MPMSTSRSAGGRFAPQTLAKIEPVVHSVIKHYIGISDASLLEDSLQCVQEGGDAEDIYKQIKDVLDHKKAKKLASKIYQAIDDYCISHDLPTKSDQARKRKARDDRDADHEDGPTGEKQSKTEAEPIEPMSSDKIKEMMENARREIEQRKAQLMAKQGNQPKAPLVGPTLPTGQPGPSLPSLPQTGADEKAKAIAALQAKIASQMSKTGVDKIAVPEKPTPVIFNASGQTVDAFGQEIQLAQHVPTLKANLRAKKRDEFKEHQKEGSAQSHAQESKFFDSRVAAKTTQRTKKMIKFNEPGKYQMEGQRLRMKAQLEKLQADISTIARKTGITSAAQLAKLVPKDATKGRIPDVEWWDSHIIESESGLYEDDIKFRNGAITNLIEHPIQMMPLEPNKPIHIPVFLTKKEMKKLRRQNRREAWKEKQDKIRIGLLPPDEPKVKMSNLMRVLGTEAVQDPTKVEAHVRQQMAKRLANHEKANLERKLTPEQRKEKLAKKLKEDTSCGVNVAVFRIKSLTNPSKRFKVETNAKQLYMTGCMIQYEDVNVVVAEGGPKQMKKYKHLMLNRIKWSDESYKDRDGVEQDNSCALVWEGQTKERNFGEMRLKQCPTESFARDFLKKHGVEHYWDQAYSGAVLEATEEF